MTASSIVSSARSWTVAITLFLALAASAEGVARSPEVARYVATEPANVVTYPAFAAKIASFAALRQPKVMIVGASEALGQVMSEYGVGDWQARGLSSAIAETLRPERPDIVIGNFAGNGLLPADQAEIMLEGMRAGASAIVLVSDLRGFSQEFEPISDRYTQPWRPGNAIGPSPEQDRIGLGGEDYFLAKTWRTKAVADFLITDWVGAPLQTALTELREKYGAAQRTSRSMQAIQTLRLKQRLASVSLDVGARFQARQLADALRILDAHHLPVVVVYATENPAVLPRLMAPGAAERDRAALEAMIHANGAQDHYLGPDPAMTSALFVDSSHPTPAGYQLMAKRIAPELLALAPLDR